MTADNAEATEPPATESLPGTRDIELSVEIAAPVDAVWRAITDGDALASWFSPIASAKPGVGGHQTFSWGGDAVWTSWITAWEPGRHLHLVDRNPDEPPQGGPSMVLDYHLTDLGGATRLDLVNSGLLSDPSWDDTVHMMNNGWRFFLWNLKLLLERHPGVRRTMIGTRPWVSGTRKEVWDRIFGAQGLGKLPADPDQAFSLRLDGGEVLGGSVVLSDRPWAFAGKVASLNDGILHVEMEGMGEKWKMGVWLSAYGLDEERCKELGEALNNTVARIFPEDG